MFFKDMVIQTFLVWVNFGDICPFLPMDMGYFSKYLKGYGISGSSFQGLEIDALLLEFSIALKIVQGRQHNVDFMEL